MKKVNIIGSGFSSLASAAYMAKAGYEVNVFEKNNYLGGRAQVFQKNGFTFDMGPTWYWMPDVFESFFQDFGKQPNDFYKIEKLNPAYRVYFEKNDYIDISAFLYEIIETFDKIEKGSGKKLEKYITQAANNYNIAIKDLVYKPGISPFELVNLDTMKRLPLFFSSISKKIHQKFKNPKLRQILEFPVLFLGAKPTNTPAFYNFMNYADFGLGTWHPKGGMSAVVKGMVELGKELGVKYHINQEVKGFEIEKDKVVGINTKTDYFPADIFISGADYHHTEQLLPEHFRRYSEKYWSKKTFAPSSLLFYIAFDKELDNVLHHTLFFDTDFKKHSAEIYDSKKWPESPLFYASFPGKTDPSMAPKGKETATFLIPIAPGLKDEPVTRLKYLDMVLNRLEKLTGQTVKDHILFYRSYAVNDFIEDYHSYKGNAYGLANILKQTAFLRPKIKNHKLKNLYFSGQLTVPGPGVPPALISGKIVADHILKTTN